MVIKINRAQIKELSKSQLKGSWKVPILLTVLYMGVSILLSYIQGELITNLVVLLLIFALSIWATVGLPNFYLEFIKKGGEAELKDSLVSSDKLMKSLVYNIIVGVITFIISFIVIMCLSLSTVFTIFSSSNNGLTLIISLIISIALSIAFVIFVIAIAQTPYIILEKNIGAVKALNMSIKMMKGYKWKYFVLELSFIGWGILSILTFGIGFIWLVPYLTLTMTNFYKDISKDYYLNNSL